MTDPAVAEPSWAWVDPEDFYVAHVAHRSRSFWLDGSGSRPWSGHTSYVGWLEDEELSLTFHAGQGVVTSHRSGERLHVGSDIFSALRAATAADATASAASGWVGFFGYAARADLPARCDTDQQALDACWLRARRVVAFDHARRRVYAVHPRSLGEGWVSDLADMVASTPKAPSVADAPPAQLLTTTSHRAFAEAFGGVQKQLRLGNSYEINLTFRTRVASAADPVDVYRRLRRLSPAPYAALITHEGTHLLSSSPERFATISPAGIVEVRPIKGTTPRDTEPERDAAAAARLRAEPKFVGENLMIVDLLRNDLSQVCRLGTVEVTDLMHVESYPAVHQLVTTIRGRLRPGVHLLEALWSMFPAGSMTGAPKRRTMQIICDVESSPRGVYAGAVGRLLDDGSADLGVVIRTLVHRDGTYTLGTGGGITVRSDLDDEYAETRWKVRDLLSALGL